MSVGSSAAGCIRDIIIGLFGISLLVVLAMVMNDGKLLESLSPDEQIENVEGESEKQQLIVFDSSTTMSDMLATQKILGSLGIQLHFDAMQFSTEGKLESLKLRVENGKGKKEIFESTDISSEAISFDAKPFIPQN